MCMLNGTLKIKLLYYLELFKRKTDEENGVTRAFMQRELSRQGIDVERNTFYQDVALLKANGYDIIMERQGREYKYRMVSRTFELAELKILVDTVQSSKFVTPKKSNELVKKITSLASEEQAKNLIRDTYNMMRCKFENEHIYYSLDAIHTAICSNKKIEFQYFRWNYKLQKVFRHNNQIYKVSPWAVCVDNEKYYMIAYDELEHKLKTYRADKMMYVNPIEESRLGREEFEKVDMSKYTVQHFGMFGGEMQNVVIVLSEKMIDVFVARVGQDTRFSQPGAQKSPYRTTVEVGRSEKFLAWIIALGDEVKIIEPDSVVEQMRSNLIELLKLYDEKDMRKFS